MAVTDHDRLRILLGEIIPSDGDDSDTLFEDEVIDDLLDRHGSVESSLGEGWLMKAGILATLVTTVEGSSRRELSRAWEHAKKMADSYNGGDMATSLTTGSTTIGVIDRGRRY